MTRFLARLVRRLRRTRVVMMLASSARLGQARRAVEASGLFDPSWYAAEVGGLPDRTDPIEHFLRVGGPAAVSPSPLFVSEWYLTQRPGARRARFGPFVDYLLAGARAGLSPHPLLSIRHYLRSRPEAARHRLGALGHYLDIGWREGLNPHPDFGAVQSVTAGPTADQPPLVGIARRGGELIRRTRGSESHPRTVQDFDKDAADRLVRRIRSDMAAVPGSTPLVTVVMPTRNRAGPVVGAVRSVLAQTYPHWQLVISDDGSTDDTHEALVPFLADPRVEYVRHDRPAGVSAARNAALARARGAYVTYLDSDNTWVPHFLEVMVGVLRDGAARAAYAVTELRETGGRGRVAWRAAPFDRAALVERNYIDCIAMMHERSLLDEVGTFDESLRRAVDWDLWIRMSAVTDFTLVPFVASTYDVWEERDDRITNTEPIGYRNAVIAKHLVDWGAEGSRVRDPRLLSVIIPASGGVDDLVAQVRRLVDVTDDDLEVVVVDAAGEPSYTYRMLLVQDQLTGVRFERFPRPLPAELAINVGVARSNGGDIVLLGPGVRVERGWDRPLRAALRDGAAAAQGRLLRSDGTVASAGLAFTDASAAVHLLADVPGDAREVAQPGRRTALTGEFLAVTAADLVAIGAFDGVFVNDLGNGDLSMRLAQATGRPLAYVPTAVASFAPAGTIRPSRKAAEDNRRVLADRWAGRISADARDRWESAGYDVEVHPASGAVTTTRRRDGHPRRWALKIGAPTVARRESWGDWHFALGLKAALERLDQEVVIDCRDAWYRATAADDDIVLVLRGVTAYVPDSRHVNLLWIISHPEQVTPTEVSAFHYAFAASQPWANAFTQRHGTLVEPLLQCADAMRFRPVEADPERYHPVLFVGNARGVRPSVSAALAAGLDIAVYGLRWDGLLPPGSWKGPYIANTELPTLYCSAGAVLNDHWEDMRTNGFLSNRLFDLAACGARVVTDRVAGLAEVFGPSVLAYDSPESLAEAVRIHVADWPARVAERRRLADRVRRDHSFDARAARLVAAATAFRTNEGVHAPTGS
jgi:GT2 family glycosyltransferase